ncbi:RidA family protein [Actinomycetospora sp. OC33-EN08]|uniref:RidA family protein n=1 Tax=Actinomycetospora aurantiaca TaxID=3129233 RepID=A0ABU8MS84_9PSEU
MPVELHNPSTLPAADVYRQVAVATGTRTVHVAGQVARTADGGRVGEGDLAAQVEQAYRNVAAALDAVGAGFSDVARLRVYVVDWTPDKMSALGAGVGRTGITATPPITLIGVSALGEPDLLVEVEATAVLP